MEISYCTLKNKEVVNISDGRNFGNPTDMIIDTTCGKILGLVVANSKNFFSIFKANNDIFIPYNRICKIGKDIILVDICPPNNCSTNILSKQEKQQNKQQKLNIQNIINDIDKNNNN